MTSSTLRHQKAPSLTTTPPGGPQQIIVLWPSSPARSLSATLNWPGCLLHEKVMEQQGATGDNGKLVVARLKGLNQASLSQFRTG